MFESGSRFRKKFADEYFLSELIGRADSFFVHLRKGSHVSKIKVTLMEEKFTSMLKNIGSSSFPNLHAIRNALDKIENYLQVRYPTKASIYRNIVEIDFSLNDVLLSTKGYLLSKSYRDHLERASKLGGSYPFSPSYYATRRPNDYQRCSNFKIKVGTIATDYSQFIQDRSVSRFSDIKNDKILVVDSVNGKNSPKPILDLLRLVKSFSDLNLKPPSHSNVIDMANKKLSGYVLATELPIWRKVGAKLVTGHPDIVLLIGDTLFVCDYKPGETPNSNTKAFSSSFIISLPQVAAYSKLHKSQYNIKKIYCVSFNEKGEAWVYQDKVLNSLENLLISKGYASWLIWKDYLV